MSTEPTMQERLDRLDEEKARVSLGGGQDKIEKQHERGKLTARERINALVDEDTFQETGMFATHAVGVPHVPFGLQCCCVPVMVTVRKP